MVGTDLDTLPNESLKILLAKEVIAVNQDDLGVAGDLIWKQGPAEVRLEVCKIALLHIRTHAAMRPAW